MASTRKLTRSIISKFDERKWVIDIRRILEQDHDEVDTENRVHIFTVPKPLMAIHPDSYIPHQVAIGPYHYTRAELHDMERYKLFAAKRNQKQFINLNLNLFAESLEKSDAKIRACYHKFLSFNAETLALMMAVDASFLLEFLLVCAVKQGKATNIINIGPRLSHLVSLSRNKAAHNMILKDMSMLENQIPLFVLRKLLELHSESLANEMLNSLVKGLCQELSPFKTVEQDQVMECAHLLDALYHYCVPTLAGYSEPIAESGQEDGEDQAKEKEDEEITPEISDDHKDNFLHKVWTKISHILRALLDFVKKIIFSEPVKFIVMLPWKIISIIPMLNVIREPMENFFGSRNSDAKKIKEDELESHVNTNKPPVLEEIAIPSVTELANAGVRFQLAVQGISTIKFDVQTMTFYLPVISLDENSNVVLRNLVAYETCNASGPLVLARYTELMNGIIDTEDDAKYLRESGIIVNRLKSDAEVASLWNGMSKSIRLTKVPFLDKMIEDVNKFYSQRWKVKFKNYMKRYVYESWRFLTLLAAILMLVFMGLQTFCTVYNCSHIVPIKNLGQ